jgi:tRNA modification GTPase
MWHPRAITAALEPRRMYLGEVVDPDSGAHLDSALAVTFPKPASLTGEDVVELQCHGGRYLVSRVLGLAMRLGARMAEPGEFTRRAFLNARIDLTEAEAVADLVEAKGESALAQAISQLTGALADKLKSLRGELISVRAHLEAEIDFSDEGIKLPSRGEIASSIERVASDVAILHASYERGRLMREGARAAIVGRPNVGKSSLLNLMVGNDRAIVTPIPGTTRDVLTRPVAYDGIPFLFADTAGLHDAAGDEVEAIGIERALDALDRADLVLWLGPEDEGPDGAWEIASQVDREDSLVKRHARHRISAVTGVGIAELRADLIATARDALPKPGEAALNERQHGLLRDAVRALGNARHESDPLLVAEGLRLARVAFDALLGRTATENMLDTLFARFCIGK